MKITQVLQYFFLAIILLTTCQKEAIEQTSYDLELLNSINAHRIGLGMLPFESSGFIWQIARDHSSAMADGSVPFGHDGFTERSKQIEDEFGLGNTAENVAWGQGTAEEVVNGWLASTGHKANIEGDYTLTGLSAVRSKDGKWYYTQIFYKQY